MTKQSIIKHIEIFAMESFKQFNIIDCHDFLTKSRNDKAIYNLAKRNLYNGIFIKDSTRNPQKVRFQH